MPESKKTFARRRRSLKLVFKALSVSSCHFSSSCPVMCTCSFVPLIEDSILFILNLPELGILSRLLRIVECKRTN